MNKKNLIAASLAIVLGLLLIVAQQQLLQVVVFLLGIGSVVLGVYLLIKSVKEELVPLKRWMIVRGSVNTFMGVLISLFPLFTIETVWTVVIFLLGADLILYGVFYGTQTLIAKLPIGNSWLSQIILPIVAGVVIIMQPAKLGKIILIVCGAVLIIVGIVIFFKEWNNRTIVKKVEKEEK